MGIRAVLWDIDDTIFDYTTADRLGMHKHLEHEGLPDGYENVEQALVVWRELTDVHWARFAAGETDFQGQRRERVRSSSRGRWATPRPTAGSPGTRPTTRPPGRSSPMCCPPWTCWRTGSGTRCCRTPQIHNQDRKLRRLGVRDRFEAMVCAVELGISKPDAGCLPRRIARHWRWSPGRSRTWGTNRTSTPVGRPPPG